jgi:hypothetical protein
MALTRAQCEMGLESELPKRAQDDMSVVSVVHVA